LILTVTENAIPPRDSNDGKEEQEDERAVAMTAATGPQEDNGAPD